MNHPMMSRIRDAMRLMRAGDLRAATTVLQANGAPAAQPQAPREEGSHESGAFIEGCHASASGTRRYKLFIPAGAPEAPRPLVVMLHGCTQTPDDFATGTRMNALAAERGFLVLYPEQSNAANASRCWNWFNASDQGRERGEPAILAGMVGEVAREHGVDADRIFVAGLSAGGAMAVILGQTHPELFAAVGAHSGLPFAAAHDLPSALAAMRGTQRASGAAARGAVPTIVFHGDRDTTVHPQNGVRIAAQAAQACACDAGGSSSDRGEGPGPRAYTRQVFRDADGGVVAESWVIHGAAHAWSGGDPRGSHTDAKGPDASREMLRFFLDRKPH